MRPDTNESKPANSAGDSAGKPAAQAVGYADPLMAIDQLEEQLGSIKRMHAEVLLRQREVAQHSKEIASQREDLDATRANIHREREEIKQLREAFLKKTEAAETVRTEVAAAKAKLDEEAARLRSEAEGLRKREQTLTSQADEIRALRDDVAARSEGVKKKELAAAEREKEYSQQAKRNDELRRALEGNLARYQSDRKEVDQQLAQLKKDREQLASEQKAGEEARWEIQAQSYSLRSQLEAAGELEAQCARQAGELRLREAEHAKRLVELGTMEKVLEKTRERLTTTMSQREADLDRRERGISEREAKAGGADEALAAELRNARQRMAEMQQTLDTAASSSQQSEADAQGLAEARVQLAQAMALSASREAQIAHLVSQQAELEARRADAERALAETREATEKAGGEGESATRPDLSKYEQAIKILSERLKAAQAQNAALSGEVEARRNGVSNGRAGHAEASEATSRHALRKERLNRYKYLLNAQARKIVQVQNALTKRHTAAEQILAQRAKLAVVAKELHRRETVLASRKARSSTAAMMFYAVATLGVLMALSWGVAYKFAPATYAAHAVIQADLGGKPMPEANLVAWQQYIESLADDPQLIETAAERLEQRGMNSLGNPGALRQELKRSLLVESATPESVTCALRGERAESVMVVLDTLVTAMVSTANMGRAQRPDGIAAAIGRGAQVGDGPVADERLMYAGGIFGGSSVLSLVCAVLVGKGLGKLKRHESEEAMEAALDERNWAVTAMPEESEEEKL